LTGRPAPSTLAGAAGGSGRGGRVAMALLVVGYVETSPDDAGDGVAVDGPVAGEGADDVEPVASAGIGRGLEPGAAVVFDLDPDVVAGMDLGADGEVAAGQAGAAVQCRIRDQL